MHPPGLMFLADSPDKIFKDTGSRLHLALFGKHPAWDDHMEDVGLATESLVEFKRRIYLEGISSCIDSGAWMKLEPESRIDEFDHELVWSGLTGVIFAVLWHSSDGRGRRSYPMVAAAHFPTARLPARIGPVLQALHKVAADCRLAGDRDSIRLAHAAGVEALVNAARSLVPLSAAAWDINERGTFVANPCFGEERVGLYRAFYAMRLACEAAVPRIALRLGTGLDDTESMLIWQVILRSQMERDAPLLTFRHRRSEWLDALQGDISQTDWLRLKANRSEIPATTDVPYEIDAPLRDCADMVLDSFVANPERIPRLDGCGSEGAGQGALGSFLSRIFRPSGS
jgi:hypothetical protein